MQGETSVCVPSIARMLSWRSCLPALIFGVWYTVYGITFGRLGLNIFKKKHCLNVCINTWFFSSFFLSFSFIAFGLNSKQHFAVAEAMWSILGANYVPPAVCILWTYTLKATLVRNNDDSFPHGRLSSHWENRAIVQSAGCCGYFTAGVVKIEAAKDRNFMA